MEKSQHTDNKFLLELDGLLSFSLKGRQGGANEGHSMSGEEVLTSVNNMVSDVLCYVKNLGFTNNTPSSSRDVVLTTFSEDMNRQKAEQACLAGNIGNKNPSTKVDCDKRRLHLVNQKYSKTHHVNNRLDKKTCPVEITTAVKLKPTVTIVAKNMHVSSGSGTVSSQAKSTTSSKTFLDKPDQGKCTNSKLESNKSVDRHSKRKHSAERNEESEARKKSKHTNDLSDKETRFVENRVVDKDGNRATTGTSKNTKVDSDRKRKHSAERKENSEAHKKRHDTNNPSDKGTSSAEKWVVGEDGNRVGIGASKSTKVDSDRKRKYSTKRNEDSEARRKRSDTNNLSDKGNRSADNCVSGKDGNRAATGACKNTKVDRDSKRKRSVKDKEKNHGNIPKDKTVRPFEINSAINSETMLVTDEENVQRERGTAVAGKRISSWKTVSDYPSKQKYANGKLNLKTNSSKIRSTQLDEGVNNVNDRETNSSAEDNENNVNRSDRRPAKTADENIDNDSDIGSSSSSCNSVIKTRVSKIRSAAKKFTVNQHTCKFCLKTFTTKTDLEKHISTSEHTGPQPFECPVCGKRCSQKSNLNTHMKVHSNVKPFACKVCDFKTKRQPGLTKHALTHLENRERNFGCEKCEKRFMSQLQANKHFKEVHVGIRPFECKICEQKFKRKVELAEHLRTHTGEAPFECHECKKRFKIKQTLEWHIRIHTGDKRYVCKFCNKRFIQHQQLASHLRSHSEEKPFECHICKSRFHNTSGRATHMVIHTGERRFQCKECSKRFKTSSALKSHMLVHTGEETKKFSCNVCDFRCRFSTTMTIHLRNHSGEKPYACGHCKERFIRKDYLKAHLKKFHRDSRKKYQRI